MGVLAALLLVLVLPTIAGAVLLSGPSRWEASAAGDDGTGADSLDRADIVLARGLACGLSIWLLGSGLLARTVGLTTTTAWVYDAVVGVVCMLVLLLPRYRARLRILASVGRRLAEVGGLTALVYLPAAIAVLRHPWSPLGSTPWYYYGLARQVAEVGHVPSTSTEFATQTVFLNDYHLFSTSTAMLLVQGQGHPIPIIIGVTLIAVLVLGIAIVALATALGAGRLGALLTVPVVIGSGICTIRLFAYRPEGFGLGLGVLIVALSADWLVTRDRRSLLAAAPVVAALSQVHGIAALCAGVLVVGVALALMTRRSWKAQAARVGITIGVFLGATLVTALIFHEASGTTSSSGGLVDRGGLADPTWLFFRAARGDPMSMPPTNGGLLWNSAHQAYAGSYWWLAPALVLALIGLRLRWRQPQARQIATYTVLSLVGLALVASVFMVGWQGYVPRRTGASRIPLEATLLLPTLLAVGLGYLGDRPWTLRGRTLRRPLPVLLVLLTLGGIVTMTGSALYNDPEAIGHHELAVWESLPLHSSDVVLANGYTEGFIPDVTPAEGLLDGRAPYTFESQLDRANALLRGAHAFFTHPAKHWDYLAAHHVTWVVVGQPGTYSLSTGNVWYAPRKLDGLESCHGLTKYYTSSALAIFRVTDAGPAGCRG